MKGNQLAIPEVIQEAISAARESTKELPHKLFRASQARAMMAVARATAQTGDINMMTQIVTEALSLPDWEDYVAMNDALKLAAEIAEKTQSVEIIRKSLDSQERLHISTRSFIEISSVLFLMESLIKIGENKKDIEIIKEALERAGEIRDLPRVKAIAMAAKSLANLGMKSEALTLINEALEKALDDEFEKNVGYNSQPILQAEAIAFISERMWEMGEREKAKEALRAAVENAPEKKYHSRGRGVFLSYIALSMARIGLITDAKKVVVDAIYAACKALGGEPDMQTVQNLKEAFSIIGPTETFSYLGPKDVFGDATAPAPEVACEIVNIANGFERSSGQIEALSIYAELLADFGQLKEAEKVLDSALSQTRLEDYVFESMARIIEKTSDQKLAENFVKMVQKLKAIKDKALKAILDPRPSALLILAPAIARAGVKIENRKMVIYALKLAKGIRDEFFREKTLSRVAKAIAEFGGKINSYDLITEAYSVAKKIKYNEEKSIALSSVAQALATLK
jgi:tetratricopeptide (TPR) repeat protein